MRQSTFLLVLWAGILILFTSCKRDSALTAPNNNTSQSRPSAELAIVGKAGLEDFVMAQWISFPDSTTRLRTDDLKLYLCDVQLQNTAGTWVSTNPYFLVDFSKNHVAAKTQHGKEGERFNLFIPAGTYQAIRFGLGLKPEYNRLDPTTFPSSHPLSLYQGMYWDWNSGYRFFLMEGMTDTTTSSSAPALPFAYHLGTDTLYQELSFEFSDLVVQTPDRDGTELPALRMELDLFRIFNNPADTIHPALDPITHTAGNIPLALRVNHNLRNAWKVFPE